MSASEDDTGKAFRIECVMKRLEAPLHRQVHIVGGIDAAGRPWRRFQQDCVNAIWSGARFFVTLDGREVDIELAWNGLEQYIRTSSQYAPENLLLQLPECPE